MSLFLAFFCGVWAGVAGLWFWGKRRSVPVLGGQVWRVRSVGFCRVIKHETSSTTRGSGTILYRPLVLALPDGAKTEWVQTYSTSLADFLRSATIVDDPERILVAESEVQKHLAAARDAEKAQGGRKLTYVPEW